MCVIVYILYGVLYILYYMSVGDTFSLFKYLKILPPFTIFNFLPRLLKWPPPVPPGKTFSWPARLRPH